MSAKVIQFPRQLSNEQLFCQLTWVLGHQDEWDNEEEDGCQQLSEAAHHHFHQHAKKGLGPEEWASVRKRISEGRERIRKRNRVKAWLQSIGVELGQAQDAEQALFLAYDRLRSCAPLGIER